MAIIDWQKLYASNQAQILAALNQGGIPAPSLGALNQGGIPAPSLGATLPQGLPVASALGRRTRGPEHGRGGALVHVPSSLDPTVPAPLICMLHGCTQDSASFAAATMMNELADRHSFVVVYPDQDRGSNSGRCWNWFLPEHQRRGAGEPARLAGIVRGLIDGDSRCTIDPDRVFVAGLSSGGAMALILALCYPDLFAGVAVHSGLPYRSATDIPSAFQAMARGAAKAENLERAVRDAIGPHARPVPSIVIHGTADRTVAPGNSRAVLRQSMAANHLAAPEGRKHDAERPSDSWRSQPEGGYAYARSQWVDEYGNVAHELLEVDQLGHAWSGGAVGGSYTDPRGPSASEAISEFFSLTTAPAYSV